MNINLIDQCVENLEWLLANGHQDEFEAIKRHTQNLAWLRDQSHDPACLDVETVNHFVETIREPAEPGVSPSG